MSDKRLIGEDASLYRFTLGTLVEGDGTTTLTAGKIYKIATLATTSIFPTDFKVGDYFFATTAIVPAVGDNYYPVTETLVADCNSWAMTLSSDEIEVTVLADNAKKYRKGKTDISGTVTGINTTDQLSKEGSVNNRFIKVVSGKMGTAIANENVFGIDKTDFFIKAFLNEDDVPGNVQVFILAQIELLGYSWGAQLGNAQEWSSDIRLTGADPVMFAIENA